MIRIEMRCKQHPRYEGKRTPKADCVACIAVHLFALKTKFGPLFNNKDGSTVQARAANG